MDKINDFDKIVSNKVFKKCIDCGYDKYSQIAIILGKSESFVKAVFSSGRKKLNLYHLVKLSYELKCDINEFLPKLEDYKHLYSEVSDVKEGYYLSVKEDE